MVAAFSSFEKRAHTPQLFCFVSLDLPEEALRAHSNALQAFGGIFVVRGWPNNSFLDFSQRVLSFREQGIDIPITIDPELFDRFAVELAPTFILVSKDGKRFDKIVGNLTITSALDRFSREGSCYEEAIELLNREGYPNVE